MHTRITKVLVINRKSVGLKHEKLSEVLIENFLEFDKIESKLSGYDACFYSMGVSSIGLDEKKYTLLTYTYAKSLADILFKLNPNLVFNYVSGKGTDGTEKSKVMWARVKGKTENYILNKGFKDSYAFRPGVIIPKKGVKSKTKWVNFAIILFTPLFPLLNLMSSVTTTTKIGLAMINSIFIPMETKVMESQEINSLATKSLPSQ